MVSGILNNVFYGDEEFIVIDTERRALINASPYPETCRPMGFVQMMLTEAGGAGYIGIGIANGESRVMEVLKNAIQLMVEDRYI